MAILKNMLSSEKSVYEHVVYDSSTVEKTFRGAIWKRHEAVKVYAKLPAGARVPTPLGTYNPDWAVLVGERWHGSASTSCRN